MNCIKRLPRSAGEYSAGTEYLPQDRVSCDGSIFVSLRRQSGNRPSVTVNGDGTYDTADGWMIIAVGASVPGGGKPMVGNPSINGVELVGDRTAAELGLASAGDIPERVSQLDNDAGYLTGGRLRTVNGESLVGEGDIKIEGGGGASVTVDAELSDSSENPVQNKVVTSKVNELETSINNITDKVYKESFVIETGVYTKVDDVSGNYTIVTDKDTINKCIGSTNKNPGHVGVSVVVDAETVLNLAVSTGDDSRLLGVASVAQSASTVIYQLLLKKDGNSVLNKQEIENVDISNYYTKNEADTKLSGYVLKIDGKSLSTNDYTDEDKTKVGKALTEHQSLGNYYTKEEVDSKVAQGGTFDPTAYYNKHDVDSLVGGKVDKVEGKQLSTNDYTDADKAKVLAALTEHQDISGKQDVITDLEAIREGAAKGETALQSFTESDPLYTKDKPSLALKSEIPDVSGLAKKTDIPDVSGLVKSSDLAEVATSGDYDDLTNKPSIPSEVTEQTVSGWGFTKNSGTYSKPTGGIPKSDLSSAVQTSLGKADTALQGVPSAYRTAAAQDAIDSGKVDKVTGKGLSANDYTDADKAKVASALQSFTETDPTVPSWAKQSKKPSYTASEVGALPSTTKIPSKTSDLSNDSGFLTRHQTLKTINGNSLVGEGDIAIEGGGGEYDITSIYEKTKAGDSPVEITADEYNGLLEAVNAGKVVKYTYGIDGEDYAVEGKSSRYDVVSSGGQTNIIVYFVSNIFAEYFTVAKSATGMCRARFDYAEFMEKNDPDLSAAYYDFWGSAIGKALLEEYFGSYDVLNDVSSTDWYKLRDAVQKRKIMDGITYMSYDESGAFPVIQLKGARYRHYDDIGYIADRFEVSLVLRDDTVVTASFDNVTRYLDGYEIVNPTGGTIELYNYRHRICYEFKDKLTSTDALTISTENSGLTDNDYGGHNFPYVFEWLLVFNTGVSVPAINWPSSFKWAGGEVVSLEANCRYEFHIVATSTGIAVTGCKFSTVIQE